MTKNVAIVDATTFDELIAQLRLLGYELQGPGTEDALGFNSEGDGPMRIPAQDVAAFLVDGSGVSFWRGPSESLYVSLVARKPRIHFDGLSAAEEMALRDSLLQLGVTFSVAYGGQPDVRCWPMAKALREWQHHSEEQMHGGDLEISAIPTANYLRHVYGLAETDIDLILRHKKKARRYNRYTRIVEEFDA